MQPLHAYITGEPDPKSAVFLVLQSLTHTHTRDHAEGKFLVSPLSKKLPYQFFCIETIFAGTAYSK